MEIFNNVAALQVVLARPIPNLENWKSLNPRRKARAVENVDDEEGERVETSKLFGEDRRKRRAGD
jgi:hypothetical protein